MRLEVERRTKNYKLQPHTGSQESLHLMDTWLKECVENHVLCNSYLSDPRTLPSRLLDVQPLKDSCLVQLTSSTDLSVNKRYITLSYCWGDTLPMSLTQATHGALYHGVPIADLPRTFQDAVAIVRRFGVKYLWFVMYIPRQRRRLV